MEQVYQYYRIGVKVHNDETVYIQRKFMSTPIEKVLFFVIISYILLCQNFMVTSVIKP